MNNNKYYIVVTEQQGATPTDILAKLSLTDYQPAGEAKFLQTYESNDDLFIGNYEGNIIIVNPDLTSDFYYRRPSDTEKKFIAAFPSSQIVALAENNWNREFGFTIIDKGQRIRVKHGHGEKIIIEIGEELPEEKTIKAGQIFDPEELDKMWRDYDEDQVMELYAFEASMRTPAEISKRFFCHTISNLDSEALKLTRYKCTKSSKSSCSVSI